MVLPCHLIVGSREGRFGLEHLLEFILSQGLRRGAWDDLESWIEVIGLCDCRDQLVIELIVEWALSR